MEEMVKIIKIMEKVIKKTGMEKEIMMKIRNKSVILEGNFIVIKGMGQLYVLWKKKNINVWLVSTAPILLNNIVGSNID